MADLKPSGTARQQSGWTVWLIWAAATCAAVMVAGVPDLAAGWFSTEPIGELWFPFTIFLTGLAQHLTMPRLLPGERAWFRNTTVGLVLGSLLSIPLGGWMVLLHGAVGW